MPSSQHAGEKRGVAGLLLGRTERAARAAELHHARGEGERVLALESREGTRASRRGEEGLSRSVSGNKFHKEVYMYRLVVCVCMHAWKR